jgi:uncharacterized protein YndB with AHSA1/START domain
VESVKREITLPASPEEAWDFVTDLGAWFDGAVEGNLAPGEPVHIGERRAVIERLDEPSRLTFRWLGEDPSRVDITLEPTDDGTEIRVTETRIESAVTPTPQIGFKALAKV